MNFVWKIDEEKVEGIALLIFGIFGGALIVGGWGVVGVPESLT